MNKTEISNFVREWLWSNPKRKSEYLLAENVADMINIAIDIIEENGRKSNMNLQVCWKCVNFIEEEHSKKVSCDYGYFENVSLDKAMLYFPIQFDCIEYEEREK